MNINLHHLELFYYVAEAQGISQAIKVIPYSIQQPAISQQMITLEKSLNVKLFERRPFVLTEAGRVLLDTVAPFMEQLATLEDDLQGFHRIRLKIGCSTLISDSYLPKLLPQLMERFPELLPHVFDLDGYDSYKRLISRELDIVISADPVPRSKAIETIHLLSLPMAIIMPKDHPLVDSFEWDHKKLRAERWIALNENYGSMSNLSQELKRVSLTPSYGAATNSITSALKYVSIGLGLGFMITPPRFLLKEHNLVALPLLDMPTADVRLSFIPDDSKKEVVDAFVEEAILLAKKRKKDFSSK